MAGEAGSLGILVLFNVDFQCWLPSQSTVYGQRWVWNLCCAAGAPSPDTPTEVIRSCCWHTAIREESQGALPGRCNAVLERVWESRDSNLNPPLWLTNCMTRGSRQGSPVPSFLQSINNKEDSHREGDCGWKNLRMRGEEAHSRGSSEADEPTQRLRASRSWADA